MGHNPQAASRSLASLPNQSATDDGSPRSSYASYSAIHPPSLTERPYKSEVDSWIGIVEKEIWRGGNLATAGQASSSLSSAASADFLLPAVTKTDIALRVDTPAPSLAPHSESPPPPPCASKSPTSPATLAIIAPSLDESVALERLYGDVCDGDSNSRPLSEAGAYGDEHIIKRVTSVPLSDVIDC